MPSCTTISFHMSWTQVFVSGFTRSVNPSDEELEELLNARYGLTTSSENIQWAGQGTTLVKRDEAGTCRGFAFLAFYSLESATIVVDRINTNDGGCDNMQQEGLVLPLELRSELVKPKVKKGKQQAEANLPDLRFRSKRKAPVRKHPVIISSDGKKTGLGNKTK